MFLIAPKKWNKQISLLCGYLAFISNLLVSAIFCKDLYDQILQVLYYLDIQYNADTVLILLPFAIAILSNSFNYVLVGNFQRVFYYSAFISILIFVLVQNLLFWKFSTRYTSSSYVFDPKIKLDFNTGVNFFQSFKLWTFSFIGQGIGAHLSESTVQPQKITQSCMVYAYLITAMIGLLSFVTFLYNLQIQTIQDYRVLERDSSLTNMLKIIFTSVDYVGD